MTDLEKRRRVMRRSIQLGHCICNPKQSCPCAVFGEKDICPCAGERPDQPSDDARLTSLVEKTGCASKISQNDLKKVLSSLPETTDPRVLVGTNTCDDAGVYKLDDDTALVQTVDVFTPCVDDAYTFGRIAAANSLSDIYAMGGQPLTALSVIAFPIETVSHEIMARMLLGGMDAMREAGVAIIGGHSINDKEPKFGYAVTGLIHPSRIVTNNGARPDDALVLTKPIGVGVICFAAQLGRASEAAVQAATKSMAELNKIAAETMLEVGVNAATDVTGFGLLGHLGEMAAQSGVGAEVYTDLVPVLDEAVSYASQGMVSGGIERNREYASQYVVTQDCVSEEMTDILYDPQTSGGLLISTDREKAERIVALLRARGVEHASIIGRIVSGSLGRIMLTGSQEAANKTTTSRGETGPPRQSADFVEKSAFQGGRNVVEEPTACCCASSSSGTSGSETTRKFTDFVKEVNADGAIPLRTKELIAIALSVLSRCEPCVKIHLEKARSLGITEEEISEAVWMAIFFGGAPTKMFYDSLPSFMPPEAG